MRKLMARCTTEKSHQWKSKALNSWKAFSSNFDHNMLQVSIEKLEDEVKAGEEKIGKLEVDMVELVNFRDRVFNRDRDNAVKVLNRVCHSQLHMALTVWVNHVSEEKRLESLKERFASKWKLRPVMGAIITWRGFVETRKKLRNILSRACSDYKYVGTSEMKRKRQERDETSEN